MQRLGLSDADFATYLRTIRSTHMRRIEVDVYDLDENHLGSLTDFAVTGQLTGDTTQTPVRVCTLSLADAGRLLAFEPKSAGAGSLHRQRKVRVRDSRYVPDLGRWVPCSVIFGPVWDFKRKGADVEITVHGPEQQALGDVWHPFHRAAKTRKTSIIKDLAAAYGETRISIPDLPDTTPHDITLARGATFWPTMVRLAASMNRHLYYTGDGLLVLRPWPKSPRLTLDGSWLLDEPEFRRTSDGIVNAVWVLGAKPKHKAPQVQAVSLLPAGHPNSPEANAMNSQPLYLPKKIENSHLKTAAACKAVARRHRDEIARLVTEASVDVLPMPFLDPGDKVAVSTVQGWQVLTVNQWGVPLTPANDPTTIGTIRRTKWSRHG